MNQDLGATFLIIHKLPCCAIIFFIFLENLTEWTKIKPPVWEKLMTSGSEDNRLCPWTGYTLSLHTTITKSCWFVRTPGEGDAHRLAHALRPQTKSLSVSATTAKEDSELCMLSYNNTFFLCLIIFDSCNWNKHSGMQQETLGTDCVLMSSYRLRKVNSFRLIDR